VQHLHAHSPTRARTSRGSRPSSRHHLEHDAARRVRLRVPVRPTLAGKLKEARSQSASRATACRKPCATWIAVLGSHRAQPLRHRAFRDAGAARTGAERRHAQRGVRRPLVRGEGSLGLLEGFAKASSVSGAQAHVRGRWPLRSRSSRALRASIGDSVESQGSAEKGKRFADRDGRHARARELHEGIRVP